MKKMKGLEFNFRNTNIKIVEKAWIWYIISLSIMLISMIVFLSVGGYKKDMTQGMNIGIDFTGGTILNVRLPDEKINDENYTKTSNNLVKIAESKGVHVSYVQKLSSSVPGEGAIMLRYKNIYNEKNAPGDFDKKNQEMNDSIRQAIIEDDNGVNDIKDITYDSIGRTASKNLIRSSAIAISVAILLILIYIIIRFDFAGGIAAIIALLHDIAIMFALTIIFRVQVNTPFVAALITILAYSINDTIVVFDRFRENIKRFKNANRVDIYQISNDTIKQSLARTINTSVTTLSTIIVLAIMGVPAVREFAFPIIFGLLAGTYSSIFIATPLMVSIKTLMHPDRYMITTQRKAKQAKVKK